MQTSQRKIIPVLLGGDLNAYSVALAFHEAYGCISHAFVRYKCGATENSHFIKTHHCSDIDCVEAAVPELLKFASQNSSAELYLIPCADWYVSMLERARHILSAVYKIHIPEADHHRILSDKLRFYGEMERAGISYPPYIGFERGEKPTVKKLSSIEYPAVLKPSDSTEYWNHKFKDMRKVYFPNTPGEAAGLVYKISDSGYSGSIILQKKVGGDKDNRVLTTFSDSKGRVVRAVLGKVILEESGKTSMGNHSAIITIPPDKISYELIDYLNSIRYKGMANFDIMFDGEKSYVLELNPRQGRSCDYLRAAGVNIAELFVKNGRREDISPLFSYKSVYWHYPSHRSVMKYSPVGLGREADIINCRGASYSPYRNSFEGVGRRLYVIVHEYRLDRALKKACRNNGK